MILGPVNTTWDVITRRHPTFFRHTKWSSSTVPLLAHVSSIILKSFEVKVYSDNGLVNNTGDNDLIYMSDTVETYVNKKDDLQMKINSALNTLRASISSNPLNALRSGVSDASLRASVSVSDINTVLFNRSYNN